MESESEFEPRGLVCSGDDTMSLPPMIQPMMQPQFTTIGYPAPSGWSAGPQQGWSAGPQQPFTVPYPVTMPHAMTAVPFPAGFAIPSQSVVKSKLKNCDMVPSFDIATETSFGSINCIFLVLNACIAFRPRLFSGLG